jgi:hypothetical protein
VVLAAFVETMEPGEMRRVPIRLVGVPALVDAEVRPDSVRVTRRGGTEDGGEEPGGDP